MSTPVTLDPLAREGLRERVQQELDTLIARLEPVVVEVDAQCADLVAAIRDLVSGGKRLRAGFVYWGWRGAGAEDDRAAVQAAAALELFQAAALLHDDVIDDSDTRRGHPAAHRRFEALHRDAGWSGDPARFGRSAAILAGDLCLSWAGELLGTAGGAIPGARRAAGQAVFDLMSTQLMAGQFFDVLGGVRPPAADPLEQARRVIRFKTVQYTVARPLQLGGALAGAGDAVLASYHRYAERIGEAFQLRDDVLGVFGDPALTGKPAGDDLREGKQTVLVALARQRATDADLAEFDAGFGDPGLSADDVLRLRAVLVRTGAVERLEEMIVRLEAEALAILDGSSIAEPARSVLAELAASAVRRQA